MSYMENFQLSGSTAVEELSFDEIEYVSGGVAPLVIAGVIVGVTIVAGFAGGFAAGYFSNQGGNKNDEKEK